MPILITSADDILFISFERLLIHFYTEMREFLVASHCEGLPLLSPPILRWDTILGSIPIALLGRQPHLSDCLLDSVGSLG